MAEEEEMPLANIPLSQMRYDAGKPVKVKVKSKDALPDKVIAEALQKSAGNLQIAATQLGIKRSEIARRVRDSEKLKEVMTDAREKMLDLCEAKLVRLINDGDREMIKFFLRCHGKSRGWVERQETTVMVEDTRRSDSELLEAIRITMRKDEAVAEKITIKKPLELGNDK